MPSNKPPRVWIVDDDEDDQFLFETALKKLIPPVTVRQLTDGEELLPALQSSDALPDLIILDLNMPRLNGFEALQQLRTQPDYQTLPVVILTTSENHDDKKRALQSGADGFLTKPPSLDKVLDLFQQLVSQWQLS